MMEDGITVLMLREKLFDHRSMEMSLKEEDKARW
jgi:hypothetical protein